jgi:hypothetical protein
VCGNGIPNDCENNKIQICHYSEQQDSFIDKCVSERRARTYLNSGKDYCGECRLSPAIQTICDDNNRCTIDKWNKRTGTCEHEPVQCPGGGRCSPAEGCLTKVDLCRKSTNEFRTCYIRDQNEFEIATPFEQPLIGQDEIW